MRDVDRQVKATARQVEHTAALILRMDDAPARDAFLAILATTAGTLVATHAAREHAAIRAVSAVPPTAQNQVELTRPRSWMMAQLTSFGLQADSVAKSVYTHLINLKPAGPNAVTRTDA